MTDLPTRKPARLTEYDYAQAGGYFITVCTQRRAHLLGHIVGAGHPAGPHIELSECGMIVDRHIRAIPECYPAVFVDSYVVMPDHIHLLLRIDQPSGPAGCPAPTVNLSSVVGALKSLCTRAAKRPLWQRGYYEHVIRSGEDFRSCAEYIEQNPGKWLEPH